MGSTKKTTPAAATAPAAPAAKTVPKDDDITSMRISWGGLKRLRQYGIKGDSDEQIVTRVLNELSAFRVRDGKPATGISARETTKQDYVGPDRSGERPVE